MPLWARFLDQTGAVFMTGAGYRREFIIPTGTEGFSLSGIRLRDRVGLKSPSSFATPGEHKP